MYIFKIQTEIYQRNNPRLHLKLLEKQKQAKHKTSRRREIIQIKVQINEIQTKKKSIPKIQEIKF
jgi:hypothetical protein